MGRRTLTSRRWATSLVTISMLGVLTAHFVVPAVIRATHAGRLPMLTRAMPGLAGHPVEDYLLAWEPLARGSTTLFVTAAIVIVLVSLLQGHSRTMRSSVAAGAGTSAPGFLLASAWIGLTTGALEAWLSVQRGFYQGKPVPGLPDLSQHALWMTPLASSLGLLVLGAGLWAGNAMTGRRVSPRVLVCIVGGAGLYALLMATGYLHWVAAGLLAAGIAVRGGASLTPGAAELETLVRRAGFAPAAIPSLLTLVTIAMTGSRADRIGTSIAGEAPRGPDILLVILDTERAASTSLHGAARPTTPFLEVLARRGIWFERAIAPTSWTLPSHAALFTGRTLDELSVDHQTPLDGRYPTIAEALRGNGYRTAGFVANPHFLGDVFGLGRGFELWSDQRVALGTVIRHSWMTRSIVLKLRKWRGIHQELGRRTARMVNIDFLRWLDRDANRPFFAFLNFYDAHAPYLPPEPHNLRFSDTQPFYWLKDDLQDTSSYTAAERVELETAYQSAIAYLDHQLQFLLAELERRGRLSNTVLIVTADHGEAFGEGGRMDHGGDVTMPLVHVPLVIVHEGQMPAGRKVSHPVGIGDLAPTILELATGSPAGLGGRSLRHFWTAQSAAPDAPDHAYAQFGGIATVVSDTHQLLRHRDGRERLFNHRTDPTALHELGDDTTLAPLLDSLRTQLLARYPAWR